MPEPTKKTPDQPTLEELLRFKRAEKPDGAFWDRFDQELHQRMMQTLVKKDPWPVQLMHALSGRIAQSTAALGAAAFLALMVVRPALTTLEPHQSPALAEAPLIEPSASELSPVEPVIEIATADYRIDMVSASDLQRGLGVRQEYHLDSIQVASYDPDVYTADVATSDMPGFASAGVALVF